MYQKMLNVGSQEYAGFFILKLINLFIWLYWVSAAACESSSPNRDLTWTPCIGSPES